MIGGYALIDRRPHALTDTRAHTPKTTTTNRRTLRHVVGNPAIALAALPAAQRELLVMDLRRGLDLVRAQKGFVDQQAALLDAWCSRVRV